MNNLNYAFNYAPGKAILIGEHAVLYGSMAIAVPLDRGVRVAISPIYEHAEININNGPIIKFFEIFSNSNSNFNSNFIFNIENAPINLRSALIYLIANFGSKINKIAILVDGDLPKGFGLGSSAAFSVALIKAIFNYFFINYSKNMLEKHVNALETIFHGSPSGLDQKVILEAQALSFVKNNNNFCFWPIKLAQPLKLVVGLAGPHEGTKIAVNRLRERKKRHENIYQSIFLNLDQVAKQMEIYLTQGSLSFVGELINIAQGYLNALGLSTKEIEHLCFIAKQQGALGAKLTGAGGGGAVIALADNNQEDILSAFNKAGFMGFLAQVII